MKKEDILKAAKELFSMYGYKKVSMNSRKGKCNQENHIFIFQR